MATSHNSSQHSAGRCQRPRRGPSLRLSPSTSSASAQRWHVQKPQALVLSGAPNSPQRPLLSRCSQTPPSAAPSAPSRKSSSKWPRSTYNLHPITPTACPMFLITPTPDVFLSSLTSSNSLVNYFNFFWAQTHNLLPSQDALA